MTTTHTSPARQATVSRAGRYMCRVILGGEPLPELPLPRLRLLLRMRELVREALGILDGAVDRACADLLAGGMSAVEVERRTGMPQSTARDAASRARSAARLTDDLFTRG